MKFAKIVFLLAAITTLGLASCKKDEAKPNLSGDWEGSWGFGTDVPSFYEKWSLENNGDMSSYFPDGSLYANGTWELNDNDIEVRYTSIAEQYTYSFTGTFANDKITGDWRDTQNPTIGGKFKMYME
jgi:hypothetical protein